MNPKSTLPALVLALASGPASAIDRSLPIELEADRTEYDAVSQVGKFFGNITITQGPLRIQADEAWFYQQGEETRLIRLKGGPVTFVQKGATAEEQFDGKSLEVEYYVMDQKVVFIDQVELVRPDMQLKSDRVRYDLTANQVMGGGEDNRVYIKLKGAGDAGRAPDSDAPAGG